MSDERITECDLQAYVDDQLDAAGRLEVADYLVRHPEVAARVLNDLCLRDAMRGLAETSERPVSQTIRDAGRRVDSALRRSRLFARIGRAASFAAVVAVVVGVGIGGWPDGRIGTPARAEAPLLLEEALMSHRTAIVRSNMQSQIKTPYFDAADVRTATRINVPQLPEEWRVLDVQLFPSDYGPSLQMVIDAGEAAPVSLIATRADSDFPAAPRTGNVDGEALAYWSRGGTAYVLTGEHSPDFLSHHAVDLADNQNF